METELLITILGLYVVNFTLWYKLGKLEAQVKILNDKIHLICSDGYAKTILQEQNDLG